MFGPSFRLCFRYRVTAAYSAPFDVTSTGMFYLFYYILFFFFFFFFIIIILLYLYFSIVYLFIFFVLFYLFFFYFPFFFFFFFFFFRDLNPCRVTLCRFSEKKVRDRIASRRDKRLKSVGYGQK